eukprot:m.811223 g.811223  ORF g.811223 m.811223 type:complete len:1052 (-) comp23389_c0_seq42:1359-4514(-)
MRFLAAIQLVALYPCMTHGVGEIIGSPVESVTPGHTLLGYNSRWQMRLTAPETTEADKWWFGRPGLAWLDSDEDEASDWSNVRLPISGNDSMTIRKLERKANRTLSRSQSTDIAHITTPVSEFTSRARVVADSTPTSCIRFQDLTIQVRTRQGMRVVFYLAGIPVLSLEESGAMERSSLVPFQDLRSVTQKHITDDLIETVVVMDTALVADMHRVVAAAQLGHGDKTRLLANGNASTSPMIDFDAQVTCGMPRVAKGTSVTADNRIRARRMSGDVTTSAPMTTMPPADTCSACMHATELKMIRFKYTGSNTMQHSQSEDTVHHFGDPRGYEPVTMVVLKDDPSKEILLVVQGVMIGDTFELETTSSFPSSIVVRAHIEVACNVGIGHMLDFSMFQIDCGSPLYIGDRFSSVQVSGYRTSDGTHGDEHMGTCISSTVPPPTDSLAPVTTCDVCSKTSSRNFLTLTYVWESLHGERALIHENSDANIRVCVEGGCGRQYMSVFSGKVFVITMDPRTGGYLPSTAVLNVSVGDDSVLEEMFCGDDLTLGKVNYLPFGMLTLIGFRSEEGDQDRLCTGYNNTALRTANMDGALGSTDDSSGMNSATKSSIIAVFVLVVFAVLLVGYRAKRKRDENPAQAWKSKANNLRRETTGMMEWDDELTDGNTTLTSTMDILGNRKESVLSTYKSVDSEYAGIDDTPKNESFTDGLPPEYFAMVRELSQHRSKVLTASGAGVEDAVDRNSKHVSNTIRDMMVSGQLDTPLPKEDPESYIRRHSEQFAQAHDAFFGPTVDTPQPDEDVSDYVSRHSRHLSKGNIYSESKKANTYSTARTFIAKAAPLWENEEPRVESPYELARSNHGSDDEGAHAGDVASYDNIIGETAAIKRQGTSRRGSLKAAIACAKNAQNNKHQRMNPFGDSPEGEDNIYLISTGHAVGRESPNDGYEKINEAEVESSTGGYEQITAEDVETTVSDQHPSAVNHEFDSLSRLKQGTGAAADASLDELYAQRSVTQRKGESNSSKLDTRIESNETGASVDFINDQFCKSRPGSMVAKDFI